MTTQQMDLNTKFLELVQQLENIGDEINDLLAAHREENEEVDEALFTLRMSIDQMSEIEYILLLPKEEEETED
jgi:hypothetical protein